MEDQLVVQDLRPSMPYTSLPSHYTGRLGIIKNDGTESATYYWVEGKCVSKEAYYTYRALHIVEIETGANLRF